MSINRIIPLQRPYVFTLIALLVAGLFLTLAMRITQGSNDMLTGGIIGTGIGTLICAITNLIYFIPSDSLFIRLITPGISTVLLVIVLYRSSMTDLVFFLFFAIVNLGLGIFWYVSIKRLNKS